MTIADIEKIANSLGKDEKNMILEEVKNKMKILDESELDEEDLDKMEDCLYVSLLLQKYLEEKTELLEEERNAILDEMRENYEEYSDILVKAKFEEKKSKKKKMILELLSMKEFLYNNGKQVKEIVKVIEKTKDDIGKLKESNNEGILESIKDTSLLDKPAAKDMVKSVRNDVSNIVGRSSPISNTKAPKQKEENTKKVFSPSGFTKF